MEDRISILPDPLIHHIFSFMNMSDVLHTTILSHRWKHLYLSTPTLNFRYHSPNCQYDDEPLADCSDPLIRCNNCKRSCNNHISFVDRVLITRRQFNILKLKMCYFLCLDANHFLTWIIGVLGLHVQEINVYFVIDDFLTLPDYLFNPDIRVLKLKFLGRLVGLPNSFSRAIRLTRLDLSNVRFPDDNYDGEFLLSCPVLETLKLCDCDLTDLAVLTVSAPLLKSLKLYSLYTEDYQFYCRFKNAREMGSSCKVKTSAPNLRSLDVRICAPEHYSSANVCVEDLVSIVSASISIGDRTANEYIAEHCAQPLMEVLTRISNVQALKVSDHLVQVIAAIPESLDRLPKLLHNLKSLMLMDEYAFDTRKKVLKVQEAVIFLERLPHIESLVWERRYLDRCFYKDKDWVESMSQGIFSCLKSFEYRNFCGDDAEQKFLEFLLERATVLKELIIKTPRLSSLSVNITPSEEKFLLLSRYGDKLSSLPCASSMVIITYQLRR